MSTYKPFNKDTANSIKEINIFRDKIGLPNILYIKRKCLNCGKEFKALGRFKRLCGCIKEKD